MNDLALGVPPAAAHSSRSILDMIRANARESAIDCDSPGNDLALLRLRRGGRTRLIHADGCCNDNHVSVEIARNADLARMFLLEAGIPVPNVLFAVHADEAVRAAILWSGPVAIAQIDANRRSSAAPRFDSPDEIRAAFMRAALLRGRAAVIGPLHGHDHRVLVIGGVAVAAVRCIPPHVTGDGVSTIRELIAHANIGGDAKRRAPIPSDGPTELALARQGLTLESRLRAGQSVRLREGCDHRAGGHVEDVTANLDRELARECARAARQIGLEVAEVRIVCHDISRPLGAQAGCVVAIDPSPEVAIYHSAGGADTHGIGRALMGLLFPEA